MSARSLLIVAAAFIAPWQLWVSAYQREMPAPFVGKYGAYGPWLSEGYRAGGLAFAKAVFAKNANELFGFLGYITLPVRAGVAAARIVRHGPARRRARRILGVASHSGHDSVSAGLRRGDSRVAIRADAIRTGVVARARSRCSWRAFVSSGAGGHRPLQRARCESPFSPRRASSSAGYGSYNLRGVREKWWVNIQSDAGTRAKPIVEWVARATTPDDVLISDHDLIVYLYTGRRAVPTATFTALGRITPLSSQQDAAVVRGLLAEMQASVVHCSVAAEH